MSRTQSSRPRLRIQKKIRGQVQPYRGPPVQGQRTGTLEDKAKNSGASVLQKRGLEKFFSIKKTASKFFSDHLPPKKRKKRSPKHFSSDLQKKKKKGHKKIFQTISKKGEQKVLPKFSARFIAFSNKILPVQKIVMSSALEAKGKACPSRPRLRTSKCVPEVVL